MLDLPELKTGWLSPNGEMWECNMRSHCETAETIAAIYNYPTTEYKHADDCLMAHGWVYIGVSDWDYEWRIGWNKYLTEYQKQFLKPYFEDSARAVNEYARYRWESEQRV